MPCRMTTHLHAKQLESKDLMTRVESDRGYRFVPSKLYLPPAQP